MNAKSSKIKIFSELTFFSFSHNIYLSEAYSKSPKRLWQFCKKMSGLWIYFFTLSLYFQS